MKKILIQGVMAVAVALTVGSCQYKDLDEPEYKQRFTVDFCHDNVGRVPESYRLAFYPADQEATGNNAGYILFDVPSSGSEISLPPGNYNVSAWNKDTEHVLTSGYGQRMSLYATTPKWDTVEKRYDPAYMVDSLFNQPVMDWPDYMVHANCENFTLRLNQLGQRLTMTPDSMVVDFSFTVKNILGLELVEECRAAINNAAGKRYIAEKNHTEDSVAVVFKCKADSVSQTIHAEILLFGYQPSEALLVMKHKMVMFFWTPYGNIYLPLDISKSVQKAIDENTTSVDIEIDLEGLNLRDLLGLKESTFDVGVDDWKDKPIDVGF